MEEHRISNPTAGGSSPSSPTTFMNEYLIITTEGHKMYYKDADCSILHREDGPAIEFTQGHKSWYQDNLRHRDDGPAIEWGNETIYWLNGVEQEPLNLLGLR